MKRLFGLLLAALAISAILLPGFAVTAEREDEEIDYFQNLPPVADLAEVFSIDEYMDLTARIEALDEKCDITYILLTDTDNGGREPADYAYDFLDYYGYGDYDDESAVIFYISFEPGNREYVTCATNPYSEKLTNEAIDEISDTIYSDMKSGDYYEAVLKHIDFTENVFKNGYRKKLPSKSWLIIIGVGAVAGLIVGIVVIASFRSGMHVVAPVGAREYLVNNSFVLRNKDVRFLYTTVTKTAKPKSSGSSGGGGGGGGHSSGGRSF